MAYEPGTLMAWARNRLKNAGVASGNVYEGKPPQGAVYPHLRLNIIYGIDINAITSKRTHTVMGLQVTAVEKGRGMAAAAGLLDAADALLQGVQDVSGGLRLYLIREEVGELPLPDVEAIEFRAALARYRVWGRPAA